MKIKHLLVLIFICAIVKSQHVESGSMFMPDGAPNGFMFNGSGDRHTSVWIKFKRCFRNTPTIMLGITEFDTAGLNYALRVVQESIMPCDFIITFYTWDVHHVASGNVNWLAMETDN